MKLLIVILTVTGAMFLLYGTYQVGFNVGAHVGMHKNRSSDPCKASMRRQALERAFVLMSRPDGKQVVKDMDRVTEVK